MQTQGLRTASGLWDGRWPYKQCILSCRGMVSREGGCVTGRCHSHSPLGERSRRREKTQGRWESRVWDVSGFGALESRALLPAWGCYGS